MKPVRCFIAICIPDVIKDGLTKLQKVLRFPEIPEAQISWARPEGIHLTLKFLGEVGEDGAARVGAVVGKAMQGISSFSVHVRGVSCFPSASSPRVLWAGVEEPSGKLKELQQCVDHATERLDFPSENRKFTPHLTLARIRSLRRSEELIRRMNENRGIELGPFEVREVQLIQSILRPEGAEYQTLQVFILNKEEQDDGE
jgi:2'-5' RNA ligase